MQLEGKNKLFFCDGNIAKFFINKKRFENELKFYNKILPFLKKKKNIFFPKLIGFRENLIFLKKENKITRLLDIEFPKQKFIFESFLKNWFALTNGKIGHGDFNPKNLFISFFPFKFFILDFEETNETNSILQDIAFYMHFYKVNSKLLKNKHNKISLKEISINNTLYFLKKFYLQRKLTHKKYFID